MGKKPPADKLCKIIETKALSLMDELEKAIHANTSGKLKTTDIPGSVAIPGKPSTSSETSIKYANPRYDLEVLASQYEVNATVKAAVDAKVRAILGTGIRVVPSKQFEQDISTVGMPDGITQDEADELQVKYRHERELAEQVIETAGGLGGLNMVMDSVWRDVETTGNGYIEVVRDIKNNDRIVDLVYVPSTTVRVKQDRSGFVQIIGNEAVAEFKNVGDVEPRGNRITGGRSNELLHFKKGSPAQSYYGVPDFVPVFAEIVGDRYAREYQIGFFEFNTVPRMIIFVSEGLMLDDVARNLEENIRSAVREKTHKTLIQQLPEGYWGPDGKFPIQIERLGMERSEDAEFTRYREFCRTMIRMACGVPPNKVMLYGEGEGAASEAQDRTFRENVVRPAQRQISSILTGLFKYYFEIVRNEETGGLEYSGLDTVAVQFEPVDLVDSKEKAEILSIISKTNAFTPNEIRAKFGASKLEGGDEIFLRGPGGQAFSLRQLGMLADMPVKVILQLIGRGGAVPPDNASGEDDDNND